jgi:hypothetical protein
LHRFSLGLNKKGVEMQLAFLLATIGLALTLEAQAQPLGGLAQGAKYSIEIHNRLGERPLPPAANPFPATPMPGYVPDPPGREGMP